MVLLLFIAAHMTAAATTAVEAGDGTAAWRRVGLSGEGAVSAGRGHPNLKRVQLGENGRCTCSNHNQDGVFEIKLKNWD